MNFLEILAVRYVLLFLIIWGISVVIFLVSYINR